MVKQHRSNVQFLKHLATSINGDPMAQMVVVTALDNYTSAMPQVTEAQWNNGLINLDSWKAGAARVKAMLDDQYGK